MSVINFSKLFYFLNIILGIRKRVMGWVFKGEDCEVTFEGIIFECYQFFKTLLFFKHNIRDL